MLHGRAAESATIERILSQARQGRSGALVLRGEAGIGKSALLDEIAAAAPDFRLLRGTGAEFEAELPYAGLHMLLRGVIQHVKALPPGQAGALGSALGLTSPDGTDIGGGDRFLVGLAVLTLLADLAEEQPVAVIIDDAHWLDHGSAEALLFAARRLEAEGVVMIFAARDLHAPPFPGPGLPDLRLSALDTDAASAVLDEHAGDLPGHVREQIRRDSDGNPLALRELAAAQREGQLASDTYQLARQPRHNRLQQTFSDRIAVLPEATQTLLLVAAADDTRDMATVLRAAALLDASIADLEAAERRQLLRISDSQLVFRHPLIRSAAYRAAPAARRMAAHRALGEVLEGEADADRRAWHLAEASTEPDEAVAMALERSAEHARERGGYSAVATGYDRAAALSPQPAQRGRRAIHAAQAALDAGQMDRANALADRAARDFTDPVELGKVAVVRGTVASWRGEPLVAHHIWTEAAQQAIDGIAVEAPQADRLHAMQDTASYLLFNAAEAAWLAGDFAGIDRSADLAGEHGLRRANWVRAMARIANGINGHQTDTAADGIAALREMLEITEARNPREPQSRVTVLWWYLILGDHETAIGLAESLVAECRSSGAIGTLPRALGLLARAQLYRGQFSDAKATATEAVRIAADIGKNMILVGVPTSILAFIAAMAGDEERCRELVASVASRHHRQGIVVIDGVLALLDIGQGRHEAALERLIALTARRSRMDVLFHVPDMVEAAARLDRPDAADEPFAWFRDWAEHADLPWAHALVARCLALREDAEAERHFTAAAQWDRVPGGRPVERARTELLYGEWLRRERRRSEARVQLRSALETFQRLGATAWAERARTELRATGENVSSGEQPQALDSLTPQERQVVRLAADGLTNRDIGAQLFLSPRTVGYHLYKAYPKLGVASRGELARLPILRQP